MPEPKEKFPKPMADWIKAAYPEFDIKLGLMKPHGPGQPEPADDADLTAWRTQKMEAFRDHFGDQLDDIPKWQERFKRKFINRKRDVKAVTLMAVSSTNSAKQPISNVLLLPEPSRTTARKLFDEENSVKFSEEASKRREALGQSSRHHAGHWQSVASSAWNDLSDEEKKHWEDRAHSIEAAAVGSGDIYRNQDTLPFKLFSLLSGLVGPQSHQIGCAAFHLLYAFRDADELLKMGRVQVADDEFISTSFDQFLQDYSGSISKPWNDYCSKVVGSNRSVEYDMVFSKNDVGHYVLPIYDEENGHLSDLRIILRQFFEASWDLTWPRSAEMPGFPWADFIAAPSDYLHDDFCVGAIKISRPDAMPPADLRALSSKINVHQQDLVLSIFRSRLHIASSRDHRTSLNAAQEDGNEDLHEILHEPTPPLSPPPPTPLPCTLESTLISPTSRSAVLPQSPPSPIQPHSHPSLSTAHSPTPCPGETAAAPSLPTASLPMPHPTPAPPAPSLPMPKSANSRISAPPRDRSHPDSPATGLVTSEAAPISEPPLQAKRKPKRLHDEGLGMTVDLGPRKRRQTHKAKGRAFDEVTDEDDKSGDEGSKSNGKQDAPVVPMRGHRGARGSTPGRGRAGKGRRS